MSGFVALYQRDGSPCETQHLLEMAQHLNNRGNQVGWWSSGSVGLAAAHWRCSITDVSHESYPYFWEAGQIWIAAHIRLDNDTEIRQMLRIHQIDLITIRAEEIIAAAYAVWGTGCVSLLRGDYAFVLWDEQRQCLLAARSPTGLSTLVYATVGSHLLCASEARQILPHPGVSKTWNLNWVATWLTRGIARWDTTLFEAIQELLPGTMLLATAERITIEPFWLPSPRNRVQLSSLEAYAEQVRWLLMEATRDCMRTESEIVFDISGGMDSSGLACLGGVIAQETQRSFIGIHSFSRAYCEKDDRLLARLVAEQYALPLWELALEDFPLFSDLWEPRLWSSLPAPPTLFFQRLYQEIWRLAGEQDIHVHIRGDNADQVFGANLHYVRDLWQEHRYGNWIRECSAWRNVPALSLLDLWHQGVPHRKRQRESIFSLAPWIPRPVQEVASGSAVRDEQWFRQRCPDPWNRRIYTQLLHSSAEYSAVQADGFLEAGMEIRHPYTDLRLIEFLLTCPPQVQYHPTLSKILLRQALQGVLPEEIRLRRSKGRMARLLFQGVAQHAREFQHLVLHMPEIAQDYLDQQQFLQAIEQVRLGADLFQPAFFSTLAFVFWVHRLPWSHGLLPGRETVFPLKRVTHQTS